LEIRMGSAVQQAHMWAEEEYNRLTLIYSTIALILVAGGLLLSAVIANKLTAPLTKLTEHITKFVDSDFELEEVYPPAKARDEIGKLTNNFLYMKKEVISTMTDFKQKVEERTQELADAYKKVTKLNEANSRFVPKEFLQNLGKATIEEVSLGDQVERDMTVVFTDIRGFTELSEELTPQENFDFLNEYYNGIVPVIKNNGGFIDKFIGDSVMALFPKGADQALKSVYGFEDFLIKLNKKRAKQNKKPIEIGTGIHTGKLILGTIGHRRRLETTVISDAVNTASRIEGLTKYYGAKIVGTAATLAILKKKAVYSHRFLDMVQVKGKTSTVAIYEFLTPKDQQKLSYLDDYNQALELVAQKEIAAAAERFTNMLSINPNDLAVSIMLDKCRDYLENNKDTWEEVTQMFAK
ncbi:MAG: adenylate/guanylate cyclase domain-containing protein, partial [Bacteroidota bacterium]